MTFQIFFTTMLSIFSLLIFARVASPLGLVDKPCSRKQHSGHVPLVGGLAVSFTVFVSANIFIDNDVELNLYLISAALMVFIGVLDDRYNLSVRFRLVGQLLISCILVFGVGVYINNLGDIFLLGNVSLGLLGIPFTFLAIIAAINAFNMIDGIDGLLGLSSIVALSGLSYVFYISGNDEYLVLTISILVATIPFLFANFGRLLRKKDKVFMGDAGSMFMGLSMIWFVVIATEGDKGEQALRAVDALYILSFPIMDMVAVILRRLKSNKPATKPGRDHAHHLLLDFGLDSKKALFLLVSSYFSYMVLGLYISSYLSDIAMLVTFVFSFIAYFTFFETLSSNKKS